jgi:CTP:molybdopterin cytidylyltransferase MocA
VRKIGAVEMGVDDEGAVVDVDTVEALAGAERVLRERG